VCLGIKKTIASMTNEFVDVTQTPGELLRIFVSLGIADADEKLQVTPLTGGVSSGIYRVDTAAGSYCLKQALPQLKVAKEWKVPVERVFAEIDWLRTAGEIVPGSVPKVIGQDEASKSFVMEYLAGDYVGWKAELLAGRVDPGVAGAVGEVIGRIHAATAHSPAIAARFATDDNFYAIRLEPYLVETGRAHPALAARMQALVEHTQNLHMTLVHGDLSPKNILIGPNGPVLLDAECAWYGDPAFDVAFCLNHFLLKGAWMPHRLGDLMASFTAFATAYFARVEFEPVAELESRVTTLLPALTLARVDGKSPAEYLDDKARDRIRSAALRLLNTPCAGLADVRAFWIKEFTA